MPSMNANLHLDHTLDIHKGGRQPGHNLEYTGYISPDVTFAVPQGRVMSLDEDFNLKTGVVDVEMAMWTVRSGDDFDVENVGQNSLNELDWGSTHPRPGVAKTTCIVATCSCELVTTEFDRNQTYHANDRLTAANADTNAATGGLMTNDCELDEDPVIGLVSRPVQRNHHKRWRLAFWPIYRGIAPA